MAKSYTRENRPKGVSRKEWDKARKAEGRDPYAKFFSDPVADRKRQEAARRTETPREVSTPQSSLNLTSEAKSQADQFISRLQGMQPSTLGGAVQSQISEPQKRQADEFISKLRGMAPASPFQERADQVVKQQQAQPKTSIFKDIARGLVKQGANVLDLVNQRQTARFMDRKLNAPSDLGKFKVLGEEVQTPISKLNEANGKLTNRQVAGLFGETALDVASLAPAGKLASIFKSGAKSVAKETAKEGLKEAFKSGVKYGSTYTPAYGVAERLQQDKGLGESLKETPKEALVGGVGGGLVGAAGYGAGKAFGKLFAGKSKETSPIGQILDKPKVQEIVNGKPPTSTTVAPKPSKVETPIQIPKGKTVYRGTLGTGEIENILKGNTVYIEGQQGGLWAKTSDEAMNYAKGHSAALGSMTRAPKGEGAFLLEGKMDKNGLTIPVKAKNIKTGEIIDLLNTKSPSPIQGGLEGIVPPKTPPTPITETAPELPKKQRGFIETLRKSNQTDDALRAQLEKSTGYDPITNKETLENAQAMVNRNINEAESFVLGADKPSAGHTATAIELIKRHQLDGNFEKAAEIADNVAEKLTKAGQSIQAAKLYENLSPEGVLIRAKKLIKEANNNKWKWQSDVELTDETSKQLYDLTTQMRGASGELKTELADEIGNILNGLKRVSTGKKLSTAQTIGQLLNPKTLITRNPLGNEIFFRLERLNKYVSTPIDWAKSTLTGADRTVTFHTADQGGYWKGFIEGGKAGWAGKELRVKSQFDLPGETFKNKWNPLRYAEKAMGAAIKSFDNAAFTRAKNQTIGELSYLRAINQGLKGKEAKEAAIKYTQQADDNILQIAEDYGKYVTFQDDNMISKGFSAVKRGLNVGQDFGAGDMVIKYPKTPGALLMRGVEYSPAGFLRSAFIVAKPFLRGGQTNPREATLALSRAITGTAGFAGLGYYLADVGIITGKSEKDKDLRAFEKTTGQGQYKVNLSALKRWALSGFDREAAKKQEGDNLYSYDWAQPVAISLSLGANANQTHKLAGADTAGVAADSLLGGVDTIQEQPLVTGISRLFGYGDIKGGVATTAQGIPASYTLTLSNQFRQYTDNQARNTYDPSYGQEALNMAKNKVPGLAQDLPKSYDVTGKPREIYQDGSNNIFNVFFNPGFATTLKETPESKMVMDIFEQSGETQQIPRLTATKQKVNGQDMELTPEQNSKFQQFVGQKTMRMFEALVKDRSFASLSDEDKAKEMSGIMTDIGKLAKVKILGDRGDFKEEKEILDRIKYKQTYREIDKLFAKGKSAEAYARINRLQGDEKKAFSQIRGDEKPVWYNQKEVDENPMRETFDTVKNLQLDGKDDEANKLVSKLSDADYKKYVSLRSAWRAQNMVTLREKLKDDAKDARVFYESLPQKEKQRLVNALKQSEYNTLKGK